VSASNGKFKAQLLRTRLIPYRVRAHSGGLPHLCWKSAIHVAEAIRLCSTPGVLAFGFKNTKKSDLSRDSPERTACPFVRQHLKIRCLVAFWVPARMFLLFAPSCFATLTQRRLTPPPALASRTSCHTLCGLALPACFAHHLTTRKLKPPILPAALLRRISAFLATTLRAIFSIAPTSVICAIPSAEMNSARLSPCQNIVATTFSCRCGGDFERAFYLSQQLRQRPPCTGQLSIFSFRLRFSRCQ